MTVQLSIITPVFNGIRFIESCILNVIEQNCADIEHIIIDGQSTDGTLEVIKRYAQRHPHIRWISEKDRGQSDAMNKGIHLAHGHILGFLNVDDFYEPNILSRIVDLFQTRPEPSLLVGNCYRWNDKGEIYQTNKPAKLDLSDLLLGWNINPFPVNPSQYFYHKSLHQKVGPYNAEEHFTMDIDFLIRAVQTAHVTYYDEFWGNYRFIEGTKTFQDTADNLCTQRFEATLHKYKKQLPVRRQMIIAIKRFCYTCLIALRLLMKSPSDFYRSLLNKLDHIRIRRYSN